MRALKIIGLLVFVGAGVAVSLYVATFSKPPLAVEQTPNVILPEVSRAEVMAMAERYVTHEWMATAQNIFHGVDPDGITVNTPDDGFMFEEGKSRGWWLVGQTNVGIPYKWGGFDLPEEFDAGLRSGKYGGDVYSKEKRRLLDDGVSSHAVGVDCSGYVSRCWQLPRSYSTRELPQLCDEITDLTELKPGDIFNKHNAHVRIFSAWTDETKTKAVTYEAAKKVLVHEYVIADMLAEGYSAWRYKNIKD